MKRLVIESLTFKEEAEEKLRRVLARVGLFDCLECCLRIWMFCIKILPDKKELQKKLKEWIAEEEGL